MEKLDGKSLDLTKENINALKQLFPEVVTEGKIDFDKLKLVLGEEIEITKERYEFTWHGKAQSLKLAQTPSTGTLRPDKESSKNWDTTENLYIEGDNLEVLKLLQKSYFGKIKMIYLDPPYNTGHDFVYKDDFRDNIKNYIKQTEQNTKANSETNGRYHTDWLNMIYARLKLARNLLTDDGVIFISIDDNEMVNLTKLCDEIFGETNKIGPIMQNKKNSKNDTINVQKNHEYILVYRKNKLENKQGKEIPSLLQFDNVIKRVYEEDNEFYYLNDPITTRGEGGTLNARPNLGYTVYYNPETIDKFAVADYDLELARTSNDENEVYTTDEDLVKKGYIPIRPPKVRGKLGAFTWDITKFNNNLKDIVITGNSDSYSVRKRTFVSSSEVYTEDGKKYVSLSTAKNIRSIIEFSTNDGTTELNNVLDNAGIFDNPKNLEMIKYLIDIVNDPKSIILDFFSGSATTAHAVMQLNAEDGGNRKFIMVQLPELTDEKSEAYKAGYKNICEIGKERIRRAGDKIVEETGETDLDIGFKVFKLNSSNIKLWDPETENLEQNLFDLQDNIKEDRTKEDLLFEILLKIGVPLTTPIEELNVNRKVIYNVGLGSVLLCLEDEIDLDTVHALIKLKPEDFDTKVIFKETGFLDDSVKTNAIQTLKKNGITDVRSV